MQILAVVVGLMLAGMINAVTVPRLPDALRHPWFAWGITAATIFAALYIATKTAKSPRE